MNAYRHVLALATAVATPSQPPQIDETSRTATR